MTFSSKTDMDPSTSVIGLSPQGGMLFTVVKPVMGIFQVSSDSVTNESPGDLLSESALVLPQPDNGHSQLDQSQLNMQPHVDPSMHVSLPVHTEEALRAQDPAQSAPSTSHMPFAEVSSLLDPNMKGSKARKYLISYDEIKRRLQAPEKMSLRSLAAYTRVSRGPASKKTLLESLNVLGLTPSTTTSVSSSFSKLTEGDTAALCEDLKDFASDYVDYGNMAKQLIPETNTVQHWSKLIETKNHLEDMRKRFKEPVNSGAFDSVTHGLGLGVLDVALDMVVTVIDQQIRILSGAAAGAADATDLGPHSRRVRRRHRKMSAGDGGKPQPAPAGGAREPGKVGAKGKIRVRSRKKTKPELRGSEVQAEQAQPMGGDVYTVVSMGYQNVSGDLTSTGTV